jgi:hypothetical protein
MIRKMYAGMGEQEESIQINNVSTQAMLQADLLKPQAPTPPPGGNVENRQPPPQPAKPPTPPSDGSISLYP